MPKVNNYAELIAEHPWLADAMLLSPQDALFMAYREGRLDGGLLLLERQGVAKDIDEFRESQPVRGNA